MLQSAIIIRPMGTWYQNLNWQAPVSFFTQMNRYLNLSFSDRVWLLWLLRLYILQSVNQFGNSKLTIWASCIELKQWISEANKPAIQLPIWPIMWSYTSLIWVWWPGPGRLGAKCPMFMVQSWRKARIF